MTRWEYRLKYTNLMPGEGGPAAEWRDVGAVSAQNVARCEVLQFRRRPRRSLADVLKRRKRSTS